MKKGILTLMALLLMAPLMATAQPGPGGGFDCPIGGGPGMGHHGPGHRGMMDCDGPRHGGRGPGQLMMLADEIDLTDAQKDQLEQLRTDFQLAQIDRRAELKKAEVTLRDLMRDDDASTTTVNRAIDDVAALKADLHKARYAHHQQMKGVLTEEQVTKLEELRKERFEDRAGRKMGRGQGRGWGNP